MKQVSAEWAIRRPWGTLSVVAYCIWAIACSASSLEACDNNAGSELKQQPWMCMEGS